MTTAKETAVTVIAAPTDSLKALALVAFDRPEKPHWSTTSAILGRIQDEALYGTDLFGKFATLEAYAKDQLDLTKGEIATALGLWRLIKKCQPPIEYERWAQVKRARALLLAEVIEVGADVAEWFTKMQAAPTTTDFEMEVRQRLGEEVWVAFKVRVPLETAGVLEEALVRAAQAGDIEIEGDEDGPALTAPEIANDRRYRHRCLEALAVHYLQTVEAPQLDLPGTETAPAGVGEEAP